MRAVAFIGNCDAVGPRLTRAAARDRRSYNKVLSAKVGRDYDGILAGVAALAPHEVQERLRVWLPQGALLEQRDNRPRQAIAATLRTLEHRAVTDAVAAVRGYTTYRTWYLVGHCLPPSILHVWQPERRSARQLQALVRRRCLRGRSIKRHLRARGTAERRSCQNRCEALCTSARRHYAQG